MIDFLTTLPTEVMAVCHDDQDRVLMREIDGPGPDKTLALPTGGLALPDETNRIVLSGCEIEVISWETTERDRRMAHVLPELKALPSGFFLGRVVDTSACTDKLRWGLIETILGAGNVPASHAATIIAADCRTGR